MLLTREYLDKIDEQPASVFVLHEKTERRFPVHKHKKGQLTYVEGGIAYIHIRDKTYVIPGRHYVWIPKDVEHFLQVRTTATAVRTLYFFTNDDHTNTFYTRMGIYPVNDLLLQMIAYTERWNGHIVAGNHGFQFLAAIKEILPEISKNPLPIALPTTQDERMRPIILHIENHLSEELTIEKLGKEFGLGERTLSRLFQSTLQLSFFQYLKLVRIVRGIAIMLQTTKSISEIAYETGYGSISAFSKAFYQLTNMRPSDFVRK
ncbi:AraC family transcriptional regulator [Segetibacter koreensis]|uniref:AraC family transcriptional regulator n=1 Tax=Segetibacter koreensis TaxID=398037 RepID=UPI00036F7A80|nr:AraC family transcriptional regulator [Segetibacter koreensis]